MNKELLIKYCNDGFSTYKIAKIENKSQTTVTYWIKKYQINISRESKIDKNELINAIGKSKSYNETLINLGLNSSSGNYKQIKKLILKYELDTSHFLSISEINKIHHDLNFKPSFTINSKTSRQTIKRYIIKNNLIPYICSKCGQDDVWHNKKISLILDHINGVNNDHRIKNLRFLCPNCNATLETHCKGSKGLKNMVESE